MTAGTTMTAAPIPTRGTTIPSGDQPALSRPAANVPDIPKKNADSKAIDRPQPKLGYLGRMAYMLWERPGKSRTSR